MCQPPLGQLCLVSAHRPRQGPVMHSKGRYPQSSWPLSQPTREPAHHLLRVLEVWVLYQPLTPRLRHLRGEAYQTQKHLAYRDRVLDIQDMAVSQQSMNSLPSQGLSPPQPLRGTRHKRPHRLTYQAPPSFLPFLQRFLDLPLLSKRQRISLQIQPSLTRQRKRP